MVSEGSIVGSSDDKGLPSCGFSMKERIVEAYLGMQSVFAFWTTRGREGGGEREGQGGEERTTSDVLPLIGIGCLNLPVLSFLLKVSRSLC